MLQRNAGPQSQPGGMAGSNRLENQRNNVVSAARALTGAAKKGR